MTGTTSNQQVTLRAMRADDLDRIAELEIELFGLGAWNYSMLSEELGAPGRWYIVAELDSRAAAGEHTVIGYAGLWFDGDVAQIMTIGVAQNAQKLGVGTTLMDALIQRAHDLKAPAMLLEVAVNNEPALAMYAKYGFETLGIRKRYYQPENLDAYVMRIELSSAQHPGDAARRGLPVGAEVTQGLGATHNDAAGSEQSHEPETDAHAVRARVFVTADQLRAELDDPSLVLLDVRWQLGVTNGSERYEQGHIPRALYADLDTQLAAPARPELGRHPLPEIDALTQAVRSWGITAQSRVVVYDAVGGTSAARAWWLLRWAGFENVRILDGGLGYWQQEGHPLESGRNVAQPSEVTLNPGQLPTITADQAARYAEEGILIDARAAERFSGEVEPVDPRAGHIPGAVNVPTFSLLTEDQRVLGWNELVARFEDAGVIEEHFDGEDGSAWPDLEREVAVYCGSGVTASHEIAVLASLGIEASLYPGSWSQWSNDPDRPAWTGA